MALPCYLAMTGAEMLANSQLPPFPAWMACQFSPYSAGLSNLPGWLPEGTMLIVNDSTPICGHDLKQISGQLKELVVQYKCGCMLLDFQRIDNPQAQKLVEYLVQDAPCPLGVSFPYARGLPCAVFLPPCPTDLQLEDYLSPWTGREVWLEAALDGQVITLRESGAESTPHPWGFGEGRGFTDTDLCIHYRITQETDALLFTLWRNPEDLQALMKKAHRLGVTKVVGLWQELGQLNWQESFCPIPRL